MKFSIITVCYNSEKTIQHTINSVLEQSYKEYELIIIDGNSEDKTMEILQKNRKYINCLISEKDSGVYEAINKGLAHSSGDIISILHSDDVFYDNKVLEKVKNIFNQNKIDFLLTSICQRKKNSDKKTRIYNCENFRPFLMRFGYSPPHPGFFAKKIIYNKVGNYDINYKIASDFDFFLKLFKDKQLKYIKKNFLTVSMNLGGLSTQGFKSYKISTFEILNILKKNDIYSNIIFVCVRFIIKIFQIKIWK